MGTISGAVPSATLEISNDGGRTFPAVLTDPLGDVGDYNKGNRWQRLGRAKDRVYRFSRTDANRQAWIDGIIETSMGTTRSLQR
jgi:hypothetical protein